ncbi:sugar transferase [Eubacterium sp. AM05-23]|uniref:sugar transferase n=1 Tax=Eubacterium TaxID=1730 RepID=UPI000E52149A|nr:MULTISPECIES: sugar transferase [Eubacterium]RHO54196.1 sugar transferase [Eubacterium sp. AM05-23]
MYNILKRIFDFFFSLLLLPVLLVLIIVVGLAIKLDDKGPIFYFAYRIGKDGKIFKMFKFRSMKINSPDIRLEDGSTYNSNSDSRVTKVGKYLRKTSIDEVPQILNILKGEMSFIGPRPDSAMWLENYTEDEKIILTVPPGISGYNQVVSRNASNTKEKIENDIYYVKHYSFRLDFWILIKTVQTVIKSKNVYRNINNDIISFDKNEE